MLRLTKFCYYLNMSDHNANHTDHQGAVFTCPKCGEIPQDDVVFLCNSCRRDELILLNGIYMCPACLKPGENFECMICNSKDVKMTLNPKTDKNS